MCRIQWVSEMRRTYAFRALTDQSISRATNPATSALFFSLLAAPPANLLLQALLLLLTLLHLRTQHRRFPVILLSSSPPAQLPPPPPFSPLPSLLLLAPLPAPFSPAPLLRSVAAAAAAAAAAAPLLLILLLQPRGRRRRRCRRDRSAGASDADAPVLILMLLLLLLLVAARGTGPARALRLSRPARSVVPILPAHLQQQHRQRRIAPILLSTAPSVFIQLRYNARDRVRLRPTTCTSAAAAAAAAHAHTLVSPYRWCCRWCCWCARGPHARAGGDEGCGRPPPTVRRCGTAQCVPALRLVSRVTPCVQRDRTAQNERVRFSESSATPPHRRSSRD